jgi:hypothetical protein
MRGLSFGLMHWYPASPRFRSRPLQAAILLLAAVATPPLATAQTDRIDAGSFTILHGGERVGREQFSLRKTPSPDGATFELRAESTEGDHRSAAQLTTDAFGSPIRYSVEIRDDAVVAVRLGGQRVRGRFATQARRPQGEAAREFLLRPGELVLETAFFHQVCFVVRGRPATVGAPFTIPVISPLDGSQGTLHVVLEMIGDSVTVAGVHKPARRWKLDGPGGLARTVWADSEGRVLRVLIPAQHVEAIRDDIPR